MKRKIGGTSKTLIVACGILFAAILTPIASVAGAEMHGDNCSLVTPPKTPVELIKNMQCAVAKNMLFDDDIFKDDEKLWKLTGGQEFFKKFPMPTHIVLPQSPSKEWDRSSVGISHFPASIDSTAPTSTSRSNLLNIGIDKNVTSTQVTVLLSLDNATRLQLTFDDIVKLFGPGWERVQEDRIYSGGNNSHPANKAVPNIQKKHLVEAYAIRYQLAAQSPATAGVLIHFDDDGYLQDFLLSESK